MKKIKTLTVFCLIIFLQFTGAPFTLAEEIATQSASDQISTDFNKQNSSEVNITPSVTTTPSEPLPSPDALSIESISTNTLPSPSPSISVTENPITAPTHTPLLSLSPTFMPSATILPPLEIFPLKKNIYAASEKIHLRVARHRNQGNLNLSLTHASGKKVMPLIKKNTLGSETELTIFPAANFLPGRYVLEIKDSDGNTTRQDFTWGVLAINTNKSIYLPKETAKLSMAVLDDMGRMVCDADLTLEIKSQENNIDEKLTTESGISQNEYCHSKEMTLEPDYEAKYEVGQKGVYEMKLTANTSNGIYTINDSFEVRNQVDFDIERTSATRIYPPNTYPVIFNIKANKDFTGIIQEIVPSSFDITPLEENSDVPIHNIETISFSHIENQLSENLIPQLNMPFSDPPNISLSFGETYKDKDLVHKLLRALSLYGHDGVDFDMRVGTEIFAADEGEVTEVGRGEYGITVAVKHSWGTSIYGHLSKTVAEKGQKVSRGELIAYSGNTGITTNPHLHFSIIPTNADLDNGYRGKIDPLPYLPFNKKAESNQSPYDDQEVQIITWNVSLKKDEEIKLGYQYLAPGISPQFYLLGPLTFKQQITDNKTQIINNALNTTEIKTLESTKSADKKHQSTDENEYKTVFSETRRWQIAADAIAVQNDATHNLCGNSATCAVSLNVPATATMVVVAVSVLNAETITSITDSDGDTYNVAYSQGTTPTVAIYYATTITPNATKSITANLSAATADTFIDAYTLTGTDTSSPIDATATGSGSGANLSVTFSTNNNDSLIAFVGTTDNNGSYSSYGTNQVERGQANQGGTEKMATTNSSEITTSSGSNNQTVTTSKSGNWRAIAVEIKVASSGPTTDQQMRHGNWFSGGTEQSFTF